MQNGPTAADFDAAPLKVADGEGTDWKLHKCFINMGDHMFTLNYDPNEDVLASLHSNCCMTIKGTNPWLALFSNTCLEHQEEAGTNPQLMKAPLMPSSTLRQHACWIPLLIPDLLRCTSTSWTMLKPACFE